jgi:Domain of unknown function (DUF4430)
VSRRLSLLCACLTLAAALLAAGCGLGAGEGASDVRLTVTNQFGSQTLGEKTFSDVAGSETVIRLLERNFKVTTRYGGGFVQSVDGKAGGEAGDRPFDWFYYVNGIEAGKGSAATRVRAGDRIWWDRHDWGYAMRAPAVVGSFPEPFLHGIDGKRLPVRLECEEIGSPACTAAGKRLADAGIAAGNAVLGGTSAGRVLRVLVGRWPAMRRTPELQEIEDGPQTSGVFARMNQAGTRLSVLDPTGGTVDTLGAGAGLVAATRGKTEAGTEAATWVATGTDERGVLAAAQALEEGVLGNHFALAIAPDGVGVPLPKVGGGPAG